MKILVAYASRHGATRGIAERVAQTLGQRGREVTLQAADQASDVARDGVVIGSAAYNGHWLKEATSFVRQHRERLADRPVWLFSSGPVGTDMVDAKGRNVVEASVPAEFGEFGDPSIRVTGGSSSGPSTRTRRGRPDRAAGRAVLADAGRSRGASGR